MQWSVYDGSEHFKAATLTQAVRLCLDHHSQNTDALDKAEFLLAQAQASADDTVPLHPDPDDVRNMPAVNVG